MRRLTIVAAIFGLVMGLAVPAFAHHYRDSADQGDYWEVSTSGGGYMHYTSSGGKDCTACYRVLKVSQRYATTVQPTAEEFVQGRWRYKNKYDDAGEIQAWMTCSGKMTAADANYYWFDGQSYINQNAYCNSWVSVAQDVYIAQYIHLDNVSDGLTSGRNVGWDGIRVYW